MRGLKALLKVRSIAEDQALRALNLARREYERILLEERDLVEKAREAREALAGLQSTSFGIRKSILSLINEVYRFEKCRNRRARD